MRPVIILIADDDPSVAGILRADFEAGGWQVHAVYNGDEAIKFIHENNPDLVVLDIGMPGINGIDICRHIAAISTTPIVILTGRSDEETRAECIRLGADDYITKPFRSRDVVERIKVVLARRRANDLRLQRPLVCGNLKVDFAGRKVMLKGHEITLSPTEYNLLEELAINANKALSSRYLLNKVWGPSYSDDRKHVHEYIDRLRAKIEEDPQNPAYIITVPGVGYRFNTGRRLI